MLEAPEASTLNPSFCAGSEESKEARCSGVKSENFEESEGEYDKKSAWRAARYFSRK